MSLKKPLTIFIFVLLIWTGCNLCLLFCVEAREVIPNVLGTIIGGLILAPLLFFLDEYTFEKVNLSGEWIANLKIIKTSHAPYKNLSKEYKIHFIQKGFELSGSGERISETSAEGKVTEYIRNNRVIVNIEGYINRKFFSKDRIDINICEQGRERETRATYHLVLENSDNMKGKFISTAADERGSIEMSRS